jgi:hypoxanthine phosphoribosyltransferase
MNERTPLQEDVQQSHSRIYHLSWDVLSDVMATLVRNIQADGVPQIIVGVQRGGLIPAVMLSHHLGIRTVLALPIRSTTTDAVYASKLPPVAVPQDLFQQVMGRDIVVADDIVGSGATLRAVLHLLCRYEPVRIRSATCCVNRAQWDPVNDQEPGSVITYIGKELSDWVVFPWEKSVTPTLTLYD